MVELKTYATHFCGYGGACYGLEQAGLKCVFAIDHWAPAVEFRRVNLNHQAVLADITTYEWKDEDGADLLWTSPSCQTFSTSARDKVLARQKLSITDKRDDLTFNSVEYCEKLKPKFFVFENVIGMFTRDKGTTVNNFRDLFKELGYHTDCNVLNAFKFGVPQKRERLFIVGIRRDVMEGLKLEPSEALREWGLIPSAERTPVYFGSVMERNTLREAWASKTYGTAFRKSGRGKGQMVVVYPEPIGKLTGIMPTITCGFGGGATRKKACVADETKKGISFLRHPTLKEGMRCQGFPDHWELPKNKTDAWQLIGNAVCSLVSKAIAEHLLAICRGEKPAWKKEMSSEEIAYYMREYPGNDTPTMIPGMQKELDDAKNADEDDEDEDDAEEHG